jgi:cell division protein FtsL
MKLLFSIVLILMLASCSESPQDRMMSEIAFLNEKIEEMDSRIMDLEAEVEDLKTTQALNDN